MLTGAALKSLKPKAKMYKVFDRDGMYVRLVAFLVSREAGFINGALTDVNGEEFLPA